MKTVRLDGGEAAVAGRSAKRARAAGAEGMSNRWTAILIGLVLLAGAAFGVWRAVEAQRPQGTDEQQIRTMLFEGERAAERLDAAALGHLISDDYRDNLGMSDTSVKYEMRRYLKQQQSLEVDIPSESIDVNIEPDGKQASISFQARVAARTEGQASTFDLPMSLRLKKERVFYYWIFPGEEWRVTSAEGYGALGGGF
jgi:hypothetical protein